MQSVNRHVASPETVETFLRRHTAVVPGAANDNRGYANDNNPTRAQNPSYTDFPTYNGHNQLTKFAWWQNVTHDAAGNTVADGNRTYKWDFEGRLIQIAFPNNPGYVLTYGYDGLGRRIVNKVDNQGSITQLTRVWCGERPCQLRNNTLSLRRYLLNGEYDNVSGERSLYLTDSRGSVRDFVSVLNGVRIGAVDYTAYRQQRQVTGTQPHFQYAGLLWDGQAGLSFSYTRPYEAGLARWLTRDWIREAGGINMYAYTGGNPVMGIDPAGRSTAAIITVGVIAVGVAAAIVSMNSAIHQAPPVTVPRTIAQSASKTDDRLIFYHGTDPASGMSLIAGASLSAEEVMKRTFGEAPDGFYLATNPDDAYYFGSRHGDFTIIQCTMSKDAFSDLMSNGARFSPIPQGAARRPFAGNELYIPIYLFPRFDRWKSSGDIVFTPYQFE